MSINKNFVIKNGLEVSTDLILANSVSKRVGIGSTNPKTKLDVNGKISATDLNISGVATVQYLSSSDGGVGSTGQYLRSTGVGIEWTDFPTLRRAQTYVATEGQTTFPFIHTQNEIDVYLNGVKLTTSEYSDSSISVTLINPAFAGDFIELVGFGVISAGLGSTTGISGVTVLDEGVPVGTVDAITSINFVGGTVQAAGTGAGVTVTITPTNLNYVDGNATITGILTVGQSSITINGSANSIDTGTITTKELKVTGGTYSTQDLIRIVDRSVSIGSTQIILNNTNNILVGDKITVSGILTAVSITGLATVNVTPYNQTFLTTTTNIITVGSSAIGVANTIGVSIGSSLSINGFYNNIPVIGFSTIAIQDSPGYLDAVLIGAGYTSSTVIPVNSIVGFSSVITQRNAVLIGTGSTSSVGINSESTALVQRFTSANSNLNVSGIVTATNGFISAGSTTPIQISLIGNKLTFTAVGIGSTTLTLY